MTTRRALDHPTGKNTPMPQVLGTGVLNWPRHERVSDRYGFVHLTTTVQVFAVHMPEPEYVPLARHAGYGTLSVRILATRPSQHLGDFARGLRPQTPTVGETLCLGAGTLQYDGDNVGLVPADGRTTDWLDPRQLYRCHEQTVELRFTPLPSTAPQGAPCATDGARTAPRRFLDEPYILERVTLEQIQGLLRPLARTDLSPLPARMREACARMHRQCAAMARALRQTPDAVQAERAREAPSTRP